ncbi:MAG: hypothetical protein H6877_09880 [Rhodobiaceae bacterium]|nr:hypothetical protein [Rhodobiaceae bacterium]
MSFLARLLRLFRRPLIDQSHEHVDPLDLIPAQPNWLEQVARNAWV